MEYFEQLQNMAINRDGYITMLKGRTSWEECIEIHKDLGWIEMQYEVPGNKSAHCVVYDYINGIEIKE